MEFHFWFCFIILQRPVYINSNLSFGGIYGENLYGNYKEERYGMAGSLFGNCCFQLPDPDFIMFYLQHTIKINVFCHCQRLREIR